RLNQPCERYTIRVGLAPVTTRNRPGCHTVESSSRSVRSRTLAPLAMSAGVEYSAGEWLIHPRLGMKIMPGGPSLAISWAACPAPLGIVLVERPSLRAA